MFSVSLVANQTHSTSFYSSSAFARVYVTSRGSPMIENHRNNKQQRNIFDPSPWRFYLDISMMMGYKLQTLMDAFFMPLWMVLPITRPHQPQRIKRKAWTTCGKRPFEMTFWCPTNEPFIPNNGVSSHNSAEIHRFWVTVRGSGHRFGMECGLSFQKGKILP